MRLRLPTLVRDDEGVETARWWEMRSAQSLQAKTYVCPFCDGLLHASASMRSSHRRETCRSAVTRTPSASSQLGRPGYRPARSGSAGAEPAPLKGRAWPGRRAPQGAAGTKRSQRCLRHEPAPTVLIVLPLLMVLRASGLLRPAYRHHGSVASHVSSRFGRRGVLRQDSTDRGDRPLKSRACAFWRRRCSCERDGYLTSVTRPDVTRSCARSADGS